LIDSNQLVIQPSSDISASDLPPAPL